MATTTDCPGLDALQAFLLGRCSSDDVDRFAAHLGQCGRCLAGVECLRGSDPVLDALQAPSVPYDEATGALVDQLMSQLTDLTAPSGDTCVPGLAGVLAASAGPNTTQEVYHFLAPAQQPDEIGRLGAYRVLKVLGIGGMGVVFQAEDIHLKRGVALKVLRPRLSDDPKSRQRFLREAQAAAGLVYDHIMPILHIGDERGVPFLVMPLLAGETLEQRLQRERTLPVPDTLRIGSEIAAGLAVAHERGFIHRDVKPSNVWLESADPACGLAAAPAAPANPQAGRVKILDFGLARALGSDATLTHAGAIVGTPAYMAPEQARGEPLDARCDLFSLGCVLYRLTTGEAPFRGLTTMATLRALELLTPKPPHHLNPSVPRALSALIVQLVAKRPGDRPASAPAVARALAAIRDGPADPGWRRPFQHLERALHRRPMLAVLGTLALVVLVLVAALAGLPGGPGRVGPAIVPRPNGALIFKDDFDGAGPATEPLKQEVSVLVAENGVGRLTANVKGSLPVSYCEPLLQDFCADFEIRVPSEHPEGGCGVMFRSQYENKELRRYYILWLAPEHPGAILGFEEPPGPDRLVHQTRCAIALDRFIPVRLEVVGTQFRVFVNGTFQLEANDATLNAPGRFCLALYNPSQNIRTVYFRNLRLYQPSGAADR